LFSIRLLVSHNQGTYHRRDAVLLDEPVKNNKAARSKLATLPRADIRTA